MSLKGLGCYSRRIRGKSSLTSQWRDPIAASGTEHAFVPLLHPEGLGAQLTPVAEGFPTDPDPRLPKRQPGFRAIPDMASPHSAFTRPGGFSPGSRAGLLPGSCVLAH